LGFRLPAIVRRRQTQAMRAGIAELKADTPNTKANSP
jgi:hypothetical protein